MVYLPHWPIPSSFGGRKIDFETVYERMRVVLNRLGNPQNQLPPVIHITGTNGKGSVSALLAQIFQIQGYKTHLYTSPHLHHCNERITLFGQPISDGELYSVMEEIRINSEGVLLTFMESITLGAILAFKNNPADVLIIECGMGGRLDSTNILENKIACVITSVSFDHEEYLGNSLEKIAFEKVMITRPNVPLIAAGVGLEAKKVIKTIADNQNCPTWFYGDDYWVEIDGISGEFDFFLEEKNVLKSFQDLPKPALLGLHQYPNFACAIATCLAIEKHFQISKEAISLAISSIKWKSRLERVAGDFSKIFREEKIEIWIDGAHNEAGAKALSSWISQNWLEQKSPVANQHFQNHGDLNLLHPDVQKYGENMDFRQLQTNFIIFGFSFGKCRPEFLSKFANLANLCCVRVEGEPRAEKSEKIAEIGAQIGLKILPFPDLSTALAEIAQIIQQDSAKNLRQETYKIMICGSLHLARDVRACLKSLSSAGI